MKVHELARVTLQNEMDLILAHRRSMRLAEMTGLSLSAQTTFATAVSEVARNTIEHGKNGCLILNVTSGERDKYIIAKIVDEQNNEEKNEGLNYAKRLVSRYHVSTTGNQTAIELYYYIPLSEKLDTRRIDDWRSTLRNEPAVSPYEEIKRKNEQLQDLAQKLQESEKQYKSLTNALPIIIFSLDEKGSLLYANEWLEQFTGLSTTQLNATKWNSVVHAEDYDAFSILFHPRLAVGASTIKAQFRLRHKNESDYYWHLASISPLNDENGKLLNWIGYFVDINAQKLVEDTLKDNKELKETQEQLRRNQKALENNITDLNRSNLELQQFAYVASHDLQEPARKISYYSDYLLHAYGAALDEKGVSYLKTMHSASLRMRNLIRDLLSYAQVGQEKSAFRSINLNGVMQDVVQDLDMMIEESKAKVTIQPLPEIEADASMMRQLFENLLSNAIKYAAVKGTPAIGITGQTKGDRLIISVHDNGIGFEEKYLPQMFALFQRLHTSQQFEGTGLGLAICKKIVALHGGSITAESQPGKGASFHVALPIKH